MKLFGRQLQDPEARRLAKGPRALVQESPQAPGFVGTEGSLDRLGARRLGLQSGQACWTAERPSLYG
jgi:hypothetical protein